MIAQKNNWETYSCIQNWYSYLKPRHGADMWVHKFLNEEQKDYARNNDEPTLLAYSPLLSGSYLRNGLPDTSNPNFSDRFESKDNLERMKVIKKVSEELEITPNQLVLAWMMNDSPRIIPVLGVSKMSQLKENIKAADVEIDQTTIDYLNSVCAR